MHLDPRPSCRLTRRLQMIYHREDIRKRKIPQCVKKLPWFLLQLTKLHHDFAFVQFRRRRLVVYVLRHVYCMTTDCCRWISRALKGKPILRSFDCVTNQNATVSVSVLIYLPSRLLFSPSSFFTRHGGLPPPKRNKASWPYVFYNFQWCICNHL